MSLAATSMWRKSHCEENCPVPVMGVIILVKSYFTFRVTKFVWLEIVFSRNTVLPLYNAVNVLQNTHNGHSLVRKGGRWGLFCEFKVWSELYGVTAGAGPCISRPQWTKKTISWLHLKLSFVGISYISTSGTQVRAIYVIGCRVCRNQLFQVHRQMLYSRPALKRTEVRLKPLPTPYAHCW